MSNGIHMDKLIKASLIASIVTISGNMQDENVKNANLISEGNLENNENKQKESEDEKTKLKDKNEKKLIKKSSFVKFITCNNCFKGFDDSKTPETKKSRGRNLR